MDKLHARTLRVTLLGLAWMVGATLVFEKWDEWKYGVVFCGAMTLVVVLLIGLLHFSERTPDHSKTIPDGSKTAPDSSKTIPD